MPDTSIPTGVQYSAPFVLTGPDGTRVAFNDQSDDDYIGMLSEVTGLDSPEVRESADDLVQQDGGIHGDFFFGRRPITMTGLILNPGNVDERNRRMTRLMQATNAMRADATISWKLSEDNEQFVNVRRQQPLRISGGWQKQFMIAVVSADPRIYSTDLRSTNLVLGADDGTAGRGYDRAFDIDYGANATIPGQTYVENDGNVTTWPSITVGGAAVNPTITNFTTGQNITLLCELSDTDTLTVDTLNRTVTLNDDTNRYGAVDFLNTDWFGIQPGINDLRVTFSSFSISASLGVRWRDAWL